MKKNNKQRSDLHPRNRHREFYNFKKLTECCPELAKFVFINKYKNKSIDFADSEGVKTLNKSLLKYYYEINYWDIPPSYLCPPIPGRADYIHYIADLFGNSNNGDIPLGIKVKCLDIGVGANCVYPIIGNREYGWSFVGVDIDPISLKSAQKIINKNQLLKGNIELKLQHNPQNIFKGIILKDEHFDISICNPPFHASLKEAKTGTRRKLNNLNHKKDSNIKLNFGGQNGELFCKGGEIAFVKNMIKESREFANSCLWFTTLISKESNLKTVYKTLKDVKAIEIATIPMKHGNKISRILAWTFLSLEQHNKWAKTNWN
ncbi:MAG TPA: 23S rRNA (adenine(1618)-N(6))-methyltransferase RlmF [Victivallales bacterium]|nr:23S rRNA (adenine(1618)-N(6))-methyltransferase RlmF [Victivallales bacterium]